MITKRSLLKVAGAVALSAAAGFGYVRSVEPRWLDVERVDLAIEGLPRHLAGKQIAQLSDIHLSEYTGPEHLADAVHAVNQLKPDWVMLTGDYVGRNAMDSVGLIEPLRELAMPAYAVLGNHDHWSDRSIVSHHLAEASVSLLVNAGTWLEDGLWLAGVDDIWSGRPDLAAALVGGEAAKTRLLMAHEPDFLDSVIHKQAPVQVQFSGHSHGGQVRFPRMRADGSGLEWWAPVLPRFGQKYPMGLRRVGGRQVYTNRGIGLWPVPYRLNCRPEITVFTLLPEDTTT